MENTVSKTSRTIGWILSIIVILFLLFDAKSGWQAILDNFKKYTEIH